MSGSGVLSVCKKFAANGFSARDAGKLLAFWILLSCCMIIVHPFRAFASDASAKPTLVRMETEYGEIIAEIYTREAPLTANHFLQYVKDGYYNGGSFYRTARAGLNQPNDAAQIDVVQAGTHIWKARTLR